MDNYVVIHDFWKTLTFAVTFFLKTEKDQSELLAAFRRPILALFYESVKVLKI